MRVSTLSATAAESIRQLGAQLPEGMPRRFVIDAERPAWVRVVSLGRRRSMDVTYAVDRDLYDIAVHDNLADPRASVHSRKVAGVCRDQLDGLLAASPPAATRAIFEPRPLVPNARVTGRPKARQ